MHFPISPEFCPARRSSPAGSSIALSRVTDCSEGMNCPSLAPCCPFTSPICRVHLLPSARPLLPLLAACLPRRSRGKRARSLLTQTWPIVNLSLALPLARTILPPPLPGQGACPVIPQRWMERAVEALSQTCPLAHSLQLPVPLEWPWRAQPSLTAGYSLTSPEKFFWGKGWYPHSVGKRC